MVSGLIDETVLLSVIYRCVENVLLLFTAAQSLHGVAACRFPQQMNS